MQKFLTVLGLCLILSISANAETNNKANSTHATHLNKWLGTYILQENLYMGGFTIQKCNKFNICEARYEAILHKSEFNDMHECKITLKLQIKSPQEAIALNDDKDFANCKIYIRKNQQGVIFTRDEKAFDSPDSFCDTMCGNQMIFEWGDVYKKEIQ
ncbi:hypothetical protein [Campylobacter sp. 2457A]|uniref:hypothetical protein n=1 Tax=Campylobacter sp. 2457A TaxID=2735784 RepID=UPI00301D5020